MYDIDSSSANMVRTLVQNSRQAAAGEVDRNAPPAAVFCSPLLCPMTVYMYIALLIRIIVVGVGVGLGVRKVAGEAPKGLSVSLQAMGQ